MAPTRTEIRESILRICNDRGDQKTACPSEVARAIQPDGWRDLMNDVRSVAADLASEGLIDVMQGGEVVDISVTRGPIRLRTSK